MAQTRYDDFAAPDTTARFNAKLKGILRQGVYSGYTVGVGSDPAAGASLKLSIRMDVDPDVDPVDSGTNGVTGNDGGGNPRRLTAAGQNFVTTVQPGYVLRIAEPVPGTVTDNGDYIVVDVVSNTQLDVERDWPSGGGSANLDFTVHQCLGYLRTPDGVIVTENRCLDDQIDPAAMADWDVDAGGVRDRIDLLVARYTYNASLPNNLCSYMIIKGTVATGVVDSGVNGAPGLDSAARPRRFTSAGQNFLTTVKVGDHLVINEAAPSDADNGTYKIIGVPSNTQLDVEIDFPSGGTLVNLDYTVTDIPRPPAITDDDVILAEIYVPAGVASISNSNITNATKIDLYGGDITSTSDSRVGIFEPGVYQGLSLRRGTAGADRVTLGAGTLLTPQHNVVEIDADSVDFYAVLPLAAGEHRFDTIIYVHNIADGVLKASGILSLTGTAAAMPTEVVELTTPEIIAQVVAVYGPTYNSAEYFTKLGTIYTARTAAGVYSYSYHNVDKQIVPDKMRVVEGSSQGPNYDYYAGTLGLENCIDTYYRLFRSATSTNTYNSWMMKSADGYITGYRGHHGVIELEGNFHLVKPLEVPSGIVLQGNGTAASISAVDNTTAQVLLRGADWYYDGANNIFTATLAPGGGSVPAGYVRYELEFDTGPYPSRELLTKRVMAGDLVEVYSPTPGTKYSTGWVEHVYNEDSVVVVLAQTGASPDPTIHADISLIIRKRDCGLKNIHLKCPTYFGAAYNVLGKELQAANYVQVSNVGSSRFEDILLPSITGARLIVQNSLTRFTVSFGLGSLYGATKNVYRNIESGDISALPTRFENEYYSTIDNIWCKSSSGIAISNCWYSNFSNLYSPNVVSTVANTEYAHFTNLVGSFTLNGQCHYNIVESHNTGSLTLSAGATYNKIYFSSTFVNSSGNSTNIHYYDLLNTLDRGFLRHGFNDYVYADDNATYTDTALRNPRGLKLADLRGVLGSEIIPLSTMVRLSENEEDNALNVLNGDVYGLANGDKRIRGYGPLRTSGWANGIDLGTTVSGLELSITDYMTGLILRCRAVDTAAIYSATISCKIDGVAVPDFSLLGYPVSSTNPDINFRMPAYSAADWTVTPGIHTFDIYINVLKNMYVSEIEILNHNTVTDNITELAGSIVMSDRASIAFASDTNVALSDPSSIKGGKSVRYLRDSDHAKAWGVTTTAEGSTTVAGVVNGGANNFNVASAAAYSVGDIIMVRKSVTDNHLFIITAIVVNNISVYPNTPAGVPVYNGGESVYLYGNTYHDTDWDHTIEQRDTHLNFRMFGSGNAAASGIAGIPDFQSLKTNASALTSYILDDGETSLTGIDGGGGGVGVKTISTLTSPVDALYLIGAGDILRIMFVGTGLSVRTHTDATIGAAAVAIDQYTVYVDGIDCTAAAAMSSWPTAGTPPLAGSAILAHNLPYGTHIVEIIRDTAAANDLNILGFTVHNPADPSITGTKLYEYNKLPTAALLTSPVSTTLVPTMGTVRQTPVRDCTYGGAWTAVSAASYTTHIAVSTVAVASYVHYTYYGTQVNVRGTKGATATFDIDGVGNYAFNTLVGPVVLGWHRVNIDNGGGPSNTIIEGIDVAKATHIYVPNVYSKNHAVRYPQNLRNMRLATPIKSEDFVLQPPCSYTTGRDYSTYNNAAPLSDGEFLTGSTNTIYSNGKPLEITYDISYTHGASLFALSFLLLFDGKLVNVQELSTGLIGGGVIQGRSAPSAAATSTRQIILHAIVPAAKGFHTASVCVVNSTAGDAPDYTVMNMSSFIRELTS